MPYGNVAIDFYMPTCHSRNEVKGRPRSRVRLLLPGIVAAAAVSLATSAASNAMSSHVGRGHALTLPAVTSAPGVVKAGERAVVLARVKPRTSCRLLLGFAGRIEVASPRRRASSGYLEFIWSVPRSISRGRSVAVVRCHGTSHVARVYIRAIPTHGARGPQVLARRIRAIPVKSTEPPTVTGLGGSGYPAYGSVLVPASAWFGGHGVDVISNGYAANYNGYYQCVELVERFLRAEHFGPPIWGNANQLYANANTAYYDRHANGSGYVPVPGDIIVLGGTTWGHVVIVDQVVGSTVYVVEQNASASGRNAISLSGSTLGREYGMSVIGVLHAKANGVAQQPPQPPPPPPTVTTVGSSLGTNQTLQVNQQLKSPNGQYTLVMQADGNLVEYGGGTAIWATGTQGSNYFTVMQGDGNLVIYNASHGAVWASGTVRGSASYSLAMQDDSNVVIYGPSGAIWDRVNGAINQPPPPVAAHGTVEGTGGIGLNERTGPSPSYAIVGTLPDGTVVNIVCQTTGPSETGPWGADSWWDKLDNGTYVSDAWVYTGSNGQVAPTC